MSEINKSASSPLNERDLRNNYLSGRGNRDGKMQIGGEIETWFFDHAAAINGRIQMMSPRQSQMVFGNLAEVTADPELTYEIRGQRVRQPIGNAPCVMVAGSNANYQLELCGVMETATTPDPVDAVCAQLDKLYAARSDLMMAARMAGLVASSLAVPASVQIGECAANMVERERLRSEWAKFSAEGADSPGLRTMGLATSAQVSLSYGNAQEAAEIMTLGNLLSPILYSVFANTSGYIEGQPSAVMPRPMWWQQHNRRAPRAGIPAPVLQTMFSQSAPEQMIGSWIDYVKSVPMVYHLDAAAAPHFETSPSFNQLATRGLGTSSNFALAESLVWPDVKLIGGQRIELRMCDGGLWQPMALTVLAAALFADPNVRRDIIADLRNRNDLTAEGLACSLRETSTHNFSASYGSSTVAAQLPWLADAIEQRAQTLGVPQQSYGRMIEVMRTACSDFMENRERNRDGALKADLRALAL